MDDKLRPLTLGEILDRTSQLYRHNFWTFAGVSALPVVAMFAVFVPVGVAMGLTGAFNAKPTVTNTSAFIGIFAIALVIGLPVLLVASVVSQASLTRTAIDTQMGQKIKVREAIKSVWPRFWRYLWLIVLLVLLVVIIPALAAGGLFAPLVGLGVVGGTNASVVAVLLSFLVVFAAFAYIAWRWLCYSMAMAACIVEEKTAWQSIKRANLLSKGARGRIFVMYLLVGALSMVIAIIADVFMLIGIAIATALGGSKFGPVVAVVGLILGFLARLLLQVLITPIPVIALVLFYFDQRVRTEGYDIELMMEQAGLTAPPVTPAPPVELEPAAAPELTPVPESPLAPSFEPGPGTDTVKEQ
ncbi:MAG: hypothetical protein ACLQHF_09825 [Terracidiphilus sp.]